MAKILTTAVVADIRQRIGGFAFQATLGGIAVRTTPAQKNNSGPPSNAYRAIVQTVAQAWNAQLTQSDRDAWTAAAGSNPVKDVFGNSITLSGFDFFMHVNAKVLSVNGTLNLVPPGSFTVSVLTSFTATGTHVGPVLEITAVTPALAVNEVLRVSSSYALKPSQRHIRARYPNLQDFPQPLAFPLNFTTKWVTRYGNPTAGIAIPIQCLIRNKISGASSLRLTDFIEVV